MFKEIIQPDFADTDALGHINNTRFPVWFERARLPVFKLFHPALSLHDWPLIMARMEVDYKAQTYWDKPVEITTEILKIGNSSCQILHKVYQQDKQVVEGKVVLIYFDYTENKSKSIPDDIREKLSEHFVAD